MLVALAIPIAQAETADVGGSSTTNTVPLNGMYGDYGYHSQMVYSQTTLEEAGLPAGAKITAITFYANGNISASSGSENNPLTIKLGQPDGTTLSSFLTDGLTTVTTTGNIWSGNTSVTLEFDSEYSYDGGNLLIDASWSRNSNGKYGSVYWLASSATGASRYANNNSSGVEQSSTTGNYLPKITFTYEAGSVEPVTSGEVLTTNLEFNTYAGVAKTDVVSIKNTGNQPFTPTFSALNAPFSIEAATEIPARQTKDFIVTYNRATVGSDNATLVVTINGESTNVTLSGNAAEAPKEVTVAEDGTPQAKPIPIEGTYFDTQGAYGQIIYDKNDLSLLAGHNITSVKFYSGTTFNESNIGGTVLEVYLMETDYDEMPGEYVSQPLSFDGSPLGEYTVVGGETELAFNFSTPFAYSGNINLAVQVRVKTASPTSHSTRYQAINWYGKTLADRISYAGNVGNKSGGNTFFPKTTFGYEDSETPATPVITVDPATVEAFSTEVGTPVTATVNVTGENLTDAITATVSGDDAFSAVLENGVVTITYNPAAAGNHTATLTLSSTGAEDVTIALNGTATAPAVDYAVTISDNSGAHNYGNVLVNSSNVWTLTITNNGTQAVTPTLSGIEAPFSTTYTAAPLAAGESATISINYAPTELGEHSNTITISFPEAGDAIAAYTCELTGKAVEESPEPSGDDNEVVKLVTVDKRSIYEPNFIDTANGNTTPQQLNCYDMRFKMAQPDDPAKKIKAGDLRPGNNLFEFYAIDDYGTEFRFATINLFAEGQPSSNPSVNAMDAPIKVTPSVEYYTEDGMPVHPSYSHNTTLNYTEKIYNDINELVDLEGVIDYVNDTWSANTATNSHPDHYNFQIRGVGQYGDVLTSLTAEYVKENTDAWGFHPPVGWEFGMYAGPNTEADGNETFYYYDLYIKKSFFDERGITGPVTVVVNTTLSGSGFNADNYKAMSVNGVEQIIAKEEFKDYSWTVPLLDSIPVNTAAEQVPMGVIIRLVSTGADFNRTRYINIYGGGTGVSNIDTVGIYKSSMNVKAYTQKQVDEDTDRSLVAMNAGAQTDVNVLAYADPAVTGYKLYKNTSASTTGITPDNHVASANHESDGDYSVNSTGTYNGRYEFVRDESLGNIDGMWLPMYPATENEYYLPVTVANGVGDDGVVRSEGNTYGSAMQQVEKNGSVDFSSSKCYKSEFTFKQDGVTYAVYNPEVDLTSELPAATGYQLYNYRLWVDYDDEAPAWDFDEDFNLTAKMDRPLYEGKDTHVGGEGAVERKDNWAFVASNDLNNVKLVARMYYKKTGTASRTARPTDSDRLYYVVEKQIVVPMSQIITGIDDVNMNGGNNVSSVTYYNMTGAMSSTPFEGVNVVVTRYTDGTTSTSKIVK